MEDWKNDRAEAEMRKHEAEMMKKLNPKKETNYVSKSFEINIGSDRPNATELVESFTEKLNQFIKNNCEGLFLYVEENEGEQQRS